MVASMRPAIGRRREGIRDVHKAVCASSAAVPGRGPSCDNTKLAVPDPGRLGRGTNARISRSIQWHYLFEYRSKRACSLALASEGLRDRFGVIGTAQDLAFPRAESEILQRCRPDDGRLSGGRCGRHGDLSVRARVKFMLSLEPANMNAQRSAPWTGERVARQITAALFGQAMAVRPPSGLIRGRRRGGDELRGRGDRPAPPVLRQRGQWSSTICAMYPDP